MKVLIACEHSGIVREAFRKLGHDAWSCDILPARDRSPYHHHGYIQDVVMDSIDFLIAHPPCDYLAVSGNRWFSDKAVARPGVLTGQDRREAQKQSVEFVKMLWASPVSRIAIENPIGRLSTLWRKPSQTIQPWQFWSGEEGKGEVKATCLWLKGLSLLQPTTPAETGRHPACWLEPPGKDRKMKRSITYPGIAAAMAEQWGGVMSDPDL